MTGHPYTKVRAVMTPSPRIIDGLATVREAIEHMRDDQVNSLVIDRRHEGDEYGMVTLQDIATQVIAEDRSVDRTNVYEIMSKPVLAVDVDMDIKYAIRMLTRFQLRRALVTEKGDMVGLVTLRDMAFRYTAPAAEAEAEE